VTSALHTRQLFIVFQKRGRLSSPAETPRVDYARTASRCSCSEAPVIILSLSPSHPRPAAVPCDVARTAESMHAKIIAANGTCDARLAVIRERRSWARPPPVGVRAHVWAHVREACASARETRAGPLRDRQTPRRIRESVGFREIRRGGARSTDSRNAKLPLVVFLGEAVDVDEHCVYLFRRDDNIIVRLCEGINRSVERFAARVVRVCSCTSASRSLLGSTSGFSGWGNFGRSLDLGVDERQIALSLRFYQTSNRFYYLFGIPITSVLIARRKNDWNTCAAARCNRDQ